MIVFTFSVHSAILLTFIKLPFSIKTFVLSIFKWPLKTGFTMIVFTFSVQYQDPQFSPDHLFKAVILKGAK